MPVFYEIIGKELKMLGCPERPTLSMPEPQVQKNYRVGGPECVSY